VRKREHLPTDRIVFTVTLGALAEVPGTPFAYWAPQSLRALFTAHPPLDRDVARRLDQPKIADVKQGLATADDLRFTRYWWEVPVEAIAISREETRQGKRWVPFAKGGRPFYHDIALVVDWANEGEEIKGFRQAVVRNESFYFRPGLAWAYIVASLRLNAWIVPQGCIFSHAGQMVFPKSTSIIYLAAILNSALHAFLMKVLDPLSHRRDGGVVSKLPIAVDSRLVEATIGAREAHDRLREWATGEETATVFVAPWLLQVFWRWQQAQRQEAAAAEITLGLTADTEGPLPITGHPLACDFTWRYGVPTEAIAPLTAALARGVSLQALATACVRWEASLRQRLAEIQQAIDEEVYRLYGIGADDRALIEAELALLAGEAGGAEEEDSEAAEDEEAAAGEDTEEAAEPVATALLEPAEHIRRLIHFLARQAIREDPDGIVPLTDLHTIDNRLERGLAWRVRERLRALFGDAALPTVEREIARALGQTLEEWLAHTFFTYHVRLFRRRPVIWLITSNPRGGPRRPPAFACFLAWERLDHDTLPKVWHVYLQPVLEGAQREVQQAEKRLATLRVQGGPGLAHADREYQQAAARQQELADLADRLKRLLQAHRLEVQSRSRWVVEKVNEIVAQGYRPCRDYGVRVNLEPLKQAGILPVEAAWVKD
jgi:hypothetical protein